MVEVDPAALRNAAAGLRADVIPGLKGVADRFQTGHLLDQPGMGIGGSFIEAYYLQVAAYHLANLRAGVTVVEAVANGLDTTVRNYEHNENINATNLLAPPMAQDSAPGYWSSYGDAGMWRGHDTDIHSAAGGLFGAIDLAVMGGAEMMALLCAVLAPPAVVVPIIAVLLTANLGTMLSVANTLDGIASDLDAPPVKAFNDYTLGPAGATLGWKDNSVAEFRSVAQNIYGELCQVRDGIKQLADFLRAVATVYTGFWAFFIGFIPALLATLTAEDATVVGAPVAEAEGAAASGIAGGAFAIVMTALGTLVTGAGGVMVATSASLNTFDFGANGKADDIPDLKQLKIEWATT
jgi:hypothetical protein